MAVGPNGADEILRRALAGEGQAVAALLAGRAAAVRRAIARDLPARHRAVLSEDDVLQQTWVDAFNGFAACARSLAESRRDGADAGPAVYAAALAQDSPLTGAFVAMSVFKPEPLPGLEAAAGKSFYILHSPEDFIPMRFPEAARDRLAAAGARTTLQTYEGGHGWHGDVFGAIWRGIEWLDAEAGSR